MKLNLLHVLLITVLSGTIIGCSSSDKDQNALDSIPEIQLNTKAQDELQQGNIRSSISYLEQMDKSYPFGPYSQQVQLDLIYAYYKSGDYALAIASIDRFLRLNPTHPNVDWVLYMRGLTNMIQDENMVQGWFNVDRSDREYTFAEAAFKDFNQLLANFPYSAYGLDAQKRLTFIKNRLATYQLRIAQYYTKREAYVAVVNRVRYMLKEFPDTQATLNALPLMENAYNELGITKEAENTQKLIQANSDRAEQSSDVSAAENQG